MVRRKPITRIFARPGRSLAGHFMGTRISTGRAGSARDIIGSLLRHCPGKRLVRLEFRNSRIRAPIIKDIVERFPKLRLDVLRKSVRRLTSSGSAVKALFVRLLKAGRSVSKTVQLFRRLHMRAGIVSRRWRQFNVVFSVWRHRLTWSLIYDV